MADRKNPPEEVVTSNDTATNESMKSGSPEGVDVRQGRRKREPYRNRMMSTGRGRDYETR